MGNIVIIIMTQQQPALWRCLHGGPLTRQSLETPLVRDKKMDWPWFRARNVPLVEKLTRVYGSCAVAAMADEAIIGMLRFYPKAVCQISDAGTIMMCMQQVYPCGPGENFSNSEFPPLSALMDKTLHVHCLMIGKGGQKDGPWLHKGIGTQMAKCLIEWARREGWGAIEATAYEDLDLVYQFFGAAGKRFWEKLGFEVVDVSIEEALPDDFITKLKGQAIAKGLLSDCIRNKYTMHLKL